MSHYSYMTIPRMEADAVQESTSAAIRRARKIADNLSLRMKTFESDLEIEQNMIRSSGSPEYHCQMKSSRLCEMPAMN